MRFSFAVRNPCFTNRPTSPRGGLRTFPAPPMETTDETLCEIYVAFPPPLLARPPRMVWRCRLRKLSSFERHAAQLGPQATGRQVLRRTAQPPLFQAQSLLLKLTQHGACRR